MYNSRSTAFYFIFKDVVSLSSCLSCFQQEIQCDLYLCLFVCNVFFLWLRFSFRHWFWELWSWCPWCTFHASFAWDLLNFLGLWLYSLHLIWSICGHRFFRFSAILPWSLHFRDSVIPWFGIYIFIFYFFFSPYTLACSLNSTPGVESTLSAVKAPCPNC